MSYNILVHSNEMTCRKRRRLGLDLVIATLPELNQNMLNGGLTFPMSTSQKSINCRRQHIASFENGVNQIKRNIHNDYSFRIGKFQDPNLQKRVGNMRWTYDDFSSINRKKFHYILFHFGNNPFKNMISFLLK